jgi:hypothetical protein
VPSTAATATAPTSAGTVESSGGPSPPPPALTSNNGGKGKGKSKCKGKDKSNDPSVALLLQSLDRHHLDVARDTPSLAVGVSILACPTYCTDVLWRPGWPSFRAPVNTSTAPAAGRGLYLVTLDEHVGSSVIGQLLQHHGLYSRGSHRLGRRLRHLEPHHFGCW